MWTDALDSQIRASLRTIREAGRKGAAPQNVDSMHDLQQEAHRLLATVLPLPRVVAHVRAQLVRGDYERYMGVDGNRHGIDGYHQHLHEGRQRGGHAGGARGGSDDEAAGAGSAAAPVSAARRVRRGNDIRNDEDEHVRPRLHRLSNCPPTIALRSLTCVLSLCSGSLSLARVCGRRR